MKKLFKMTAVFLGWSSCVAQPGKCLEQQKADALVAPEVGKNESDGVSSGLSVFQNLDKIYYL